MDTKKLMAAVGLVALLTLTGAGCKDIGKKKSGGSLLDQTENRSNDSSDDEDEEVSAADVYKRAPDLEISGDAEGQSEVLQDLVEEQFGDVKVTSYLTSFPSERSVSIEFTAKRFATGKDISEMTALLKKRGYTIEFSGVADGAATISAKDKKNYIFLGFEVGKSKIATWVSPAEEMGGYGSNEE